MGGPGSGAKRTPEMMQRNAAMAALYRDGYTLQQIGDQYGVSRERVRQVIDALGVVASEGGVSKRAQIAKARRKAKDDARYMHRWGCTVGQHRELLRIGRDMMASGIGRDRTPTGAFQAQRRNAANRGIGWELTLWQWWTIWQESGHWDERGRCGVSYVMCREGDTGPYAVGNVFIATNIDNVSSSKHKKSGLPTGVSQARSGRFCAHRQINGSVVRLGTFDTAEIAHAAYLVAGEQSAA